MGDISERWPTHSSPPKKYTKKNPRKSISGDPGVASGEYRPIREKGIMRSGSVRILRISNFKEAIKTSQSYKCGENLLEDPENHRRIHRKY
jgi:hypothetical protein